MSEESSWVFSLSDLPQELAIHPMRSFSVFEHSLGCCPKRVVISCERLFKKQRIGRKVHHIFCEMDIWISKELLRDVCLLSVFLSVGADCGVMVKF